MINENEYYLNNDKLIETIGPLPP